MKSRWLPFAGIAFLASALALPSSAQFVPPGTEIHVQLLTALNTGNAQPGQEFSATLAQPLTAGKTVWPKGTQVKGRVVDVVSSGRLSRPASITLQLTQIGNAPVQTEPEQIDGRSHGGRNAGLIVGGAAAGAILGGLAGGGKGAVIGTLAGAGAGTITAAATGKKEIELRAETPLNFAIAGAAAARQPEPPQPPPAAARVQVESRPAPPPPPEAEPPAYSDQPSAYREPEYRREYRGDDHDRDDDRDHYRDRRPEFSDRERREIREYVRTNGYGRGLPPGLRNERDLPPGLERQMRRDGSLPPGLQRRAGSFPWDLERRMDRLPPRYSYVILSGRAMILRDGADIVDMIFVY